MSSDKKPIATLLVVDDDIEIRSLLSDYLSTDSCADCRQAVVFQGAVMHTVQARESALQRCIDNLIDNALKYGGEAHVILRDGKDAVVVEITDRGPGIPSGDMEKMFEPFCRDDAARTHPRQSGSRLRSVHRPPDRADLRW